MTLNDRERFILHTMSVMVVDTLIKKVKYDKDAFKDTVPLTVEGMIEVMDEIRIGRCRKLNKLDISELYEEIQEEMMLGEAIHKDNL
tara:strand:- start:289 stop:549 length:261 start_codon:yes stop_codon:yes gene_type:complete